jgi:hypothetical protein
MIGYEAVLKNIKKLPKEMEEAALDVSKSVAPQMEEYAKENRRWIDRTGHARQGLVGRFIYVPKLYIGCRIYSKIDYAIWLELMQGGKYAILDETRNKFAGQFFDKIGTRLKAKGVL